MLNSKVNELTDNDIVEMVMRKKNNRRKMRGDKKNTISHSDTFKLFEEELKYSG